MKSINKMTDKEMIEVLSKTPVFGKLEYINDILKEAYRQNRFNVLDYVAKTPRLVAIADIHNILFDYIYLKKDGVGKNILDTLLDNPPDIIASFSGDKFTKLCGSSAKLAAASLLHKNTPNYICFKIINDNQLSEPKTFFFSANENLIPQLENQSPILVEMVKMIRSGIRWENTYSSLEMSKRLQTMPSDRFYEEVISGELSPEVVSDILDRLSERPSNFPTPTKLLKSLDENDDPDVKLTILLKKSQKLSNDEFIKAISNHLKHTNLDSNSINTIWFMTMKKLSSQSGSIITYMLENYPSEDNLLLMFAKRSVGIAANIIKELQHHYNKINYNKAEAVLERLITIGLETPALKDLTLSLPKALFDEIRMKPEHRQLVEDKYGKEEKEPDDIMEDVFGSNTNWYKIASSNLVVESGMKENISSAVLAAMIMFMGGSSLDAAIKRNKADKNEVLKALNDKDTVEKIRHYLNDNNTTQPLNQQPKTNNISGVNDSIYNYIKKHEGVRLEVYNDSEGIPTIGIGHKIKPGEDFSNGITEEEAKQLFTQDLKEHLTRAKALFPKFDTYPVYIQSALLDGVFRGDYKSTHNTTKLINSNQWDEASKEYLNRDDYRKSIQNETGVHSRLEENAKLMSQYAKQLRQTNV